MVMPYKKQKQKNIGSVCRYSAKRLENSINPILQGISLFYTLSTALEFLSLLNICCNIKHFHTDKALHTHKTQRCLHTVQIYNIF